jgi:antitoxin MazE
VRTKIIKIGNSQGIRIPKVMIEESGISGEVEITVKKGSLIISPPDHPREGWGEAFKQFSQDGADVMIDGDQTLESKFDTAEWEW